MGLKNLGFVNTVNLTGNLIQKLSQFFFDKTLSGATQICRQNLADLLEALGERLSDSGSPKESDSVIELTDSPLESNLVCSSGS